MDQETRLFKKTAVITGAASGIGQAIAVRFAKEGCNLGLLDIDPIGLNETMSRVNLYEVTKHSCLVDVTQRKLIENSLDFLQKELDPIEILVNCAGIFFACPFDQLTDEQWERMLKVNLTSCFLISQVMIRYWLKIHLPGVIINIGSVSGERSNAGASHYCVAKAGVASLSRSIAVEYADQGIRAITLAPGYTTTPLTALETKDPAVLARWQEHIPLHRLADPAEIANVALFLATDEASYITGHVVYADGGFLLS
jgi:NAD(P)-dependent dehydrogenase (short-subunit alcohol dehydrogenase family)